MPPILQLCLIFLPGIYKNMTLFLFYILILFFIDIPQAVRKQKVRNYCCAHWLYPQDLELYFVLSRCSVGMCSVGLGESPGDQRQKLFLEIWYVNVRAAGSRFKNAEKLTFFKVASWTNWNHRPNYANNPLMKLPQVHSRPPRWFQKQCGSVSISEW